MYEEDSNQVVVRAVLVVVRFLWDWHKAQNTRLRSMDATIVWPLEQVRGKMMDMLTRTTSTLRDPDASRRLRFNIVSTVVEGKIWFEGRSKDERILEYNAADHIETLQFRLVKSTLFNFTKRMMWFIRGWLGSSVRLRAPELRDGALERRLGDKRRYDGIASSAAEGESALARRPCFNAVPVQ